MSIAPPNNIPCDSNNAVDVAIRPKLSNSRISMREVYILYLILHFIFHKDLTRKSFF